MLGRVTGDLSPNGISPSVQNYFNQARQGLTSDFDAQGKGEQAYLKQAFAQAGPRALFNPHQIDDASLSAARNLDIERNNAMRRLDLQEASAGLTQFNSLMNLLAGGTGTALNMAGGFGQAQAAAIGGLPSTSRGSGALGGALAGAGAGATFGPYGAVAGGVLGGLGGYFGSGG